MARAYNTNNACDYRVPELQNVLHSMGTETRTCQRLSAQDETQGLERIRQMQLTSGSPVFPFIYSAKSEREP